MNPYSVKHETITINQIDYLIETLKDNQQFNDDSFAARALGISSATWPLFGLVWPASRILATTVSVLELNNRRVLEIGCGIALSSIVLHGMGANITASDYHPLARRFLDRNIKHNDLPPIKYQTGNWDSTNPQLGKFDLIIGSDVLYEPGQAASVSKFIDCHSSDDVEVMIVDPGRSNRSRFTHNMTGLGYAHEFENFDESQSGPNACKGRILHYKRNGTDLA